MRIFQSKSLSIVTHPCHSKQTSNYFNIKQFSSHYLQTLNLIINNNHHIMQMSSCYPHLMQVKMYFPLILSSRRKSITKFETHSNSCIHETRVLFQNMISFNGSKLHAIHLLNESNAQNEAAFIFCKWIPLILFGLILWALILFGLILCSLILCSSIVYS